MPEYKIALAYQPSEFPADHTFSTSPPYEIPPFQRARWCTHRNIRRISESTRSPPDRNRPTPPVSLSGCSTFSSLPRSRGVYRIPPHSRNPFFLPPLPIYTLGMHLLDGFFRSPSVELLFSDAATVQAILDFEAALARAQASGGLISGLAAAAITSSCRADLFDLPSLAQAMPAAGNLAIPLLKQLNAIVGRNSPDALRYVHFGATSQDALDTGLVLQLRNATRAIENDLNAIAAALVQLTETH